MESRVLVGATFLRNDAELGRADEVQFLYVSPAPISFGVRA